MVSDLDFKKVNKPDEIPDSCVRNGDYVIRRNGSRVNYFYHKSDNQWYYISDIGSSLDAYYRSDWELYPNIDHKIYEKMLDIPLNYLSTEWQLNVRAYSIHKRNLKSKRENSLIRFKIIGK